MTMRRRFLRAAGVVLLTVPVVLGVALFRLYAGNGLGDQVADRGGLVLRLGCLGGAVCIVLGVNLGHRFGKKPGR